MVLEYHMVDLATFYSLNGERWQPEVAVSSLSSEDNGFESQHSAR